ncbi:alpha/beta fold hydrolase [Parahaliea mediterranea]|uniref:alpha/beta fold hydrolase n=1 Tax=Parahaliea mediterranea TaxID=651086 RepID=UPI001300580B|nr:alpha/beta fold hydrolase [Parahaliea mediterranea]
MDAVWRRLAAWVPGPSAALLAGLIGSGAAQAGGLQADASGQLVYGALTFSPCALNSASGQSVEAHCTTLPVPENTANPAGRHIELALALIPATGQAKGDPVFMLAGGPGQSARESYPNLQQAFEEVLQHRHILLLDARGTGGSHPLHCEQAEAEAALTSLAQQSEDAARALAAQCRDALSAQADFRYYTTTEHIDDLERVRAALQVARINLVGISYGTRVAQHYARRFPGHTRALVLDSVVPNTLVLGQEHARNLETALQRQFARCRETPACAQALGDPRQQLNTARQQLTGNTLGPVRYRDPITGAWREEVPRFEHLAILLRMYAYQPAMAASLPLLLHEVAQGNYDGLLAQAQLVTRELGQALAMGMSLSVTCTEDAVDFRDNPGDAGTVLGTEFITLTRAMCSQWPLGARPAGFREPLQGDVPVLAISGEFDPVTPPRYGDAVIAPLARGRHLVLPGQSHSVLGTGCLPNLVAQFLDTTDAAALDATCLQRLTSPPPFSGRYGWEP